MTSWRTWSGRWAAVLAGAALAVAPAAARACDGEDEADEHAPAEVQGRDTLENEASRQAFVKSVEKMGSDQERSRALLQLMADAPISEATGAAILEVASRMQSDRALGRVLSFFHEIQESDLVRGPLAQRYLDAASRLEAPEALARALVQELHPEAIPDPAVARALELTQRVTTDEGVAKVLREVTDHQNVTADVETRVRALAERIHDGDLKARALERLERAKGGDRHAFFHREFRLPRFAFRFGDEDRAVPPAPPMPPVPPAPPMAPMAPAPPAPPAPPAEAPVPRDGEVIINGRTHTLTPEQREEIRESARKIREQARQMQEQIRDQMREMRRKLRDDLRHRGEREDIDGSDFDLDLDLN